MNTLAGDSIPNRTKLIPRQCAAINHVADHGHGTLRHLRGFVNANEIAFVDLNWAGDSNYFLHFEHSPMLNLVDNARIVVLQYALVNRKRATEVREHDGSPDLNNTGDVVMAETNSTKPSLSQARIAELTAKGYTARAAERVAKRERKLASPQHKAAVARRLALADTRFEATGEFKW